MRESSPSRADTVWQRFIGMYGADAVRRRFGDTPPPEWRATIDRSLNHDEIQRGLRRLLYGGKPYVPALPEFVKVCKAVGSDADGNDERQPSQAPALPPPGDVWTFAANRHALAYLMRRVVARNPAPPALVDAVSRARLEWADTMRIASDDEREDGGKALWNNLMRRAETEAAA